MQKQRWSLHEIYERLVLAYGHPQWWPAESSFEVILGAILTQNTSWRNVELALENLRSKKLLTLSGLARISQSELAVLIRPAGYYNQKAKKLKIFLEYLDNTFQLNLEELLALPLKTLREELLKLWGIGEETADSICLYAANRPIFVVDAYTIRLFTRLGWVSQTITYSQMQALFMKNLEHDARVFNEYHALIITHGKERCRKRSPKCGQCILQEKCAYRIQSFRHANTA
jgi:endonuclease-3 related protein